MENDIYALHSIFWGKSENGIFSSEEQRCLK